MIAVAAFLTGTKLSRNGNLQTDVEINIQPQTRFYFRKYVLCSITITSYFRKRNQQNQAWNIHILHTPLLSVSADVRSSFFWHLARRRLVTEVSGQPIGPIFKGQAIQPFFLDCLTLENGSDRLSRSTIYGLQYPRSTPR